MPCTLVPVPLPSPSLPASILHPNPTHTPSSTPLKPHFPDLLSCSIHMKNKIKVYISCCCFFCFSFFILFFFVSCSATSSFSPYLHLFCSLVPLSFTPLPSVVHSMFNPVWMSFFKKTFFFLNGCFPCHSSFFKTYQFCFICFLIWERPMIRRNWLRAFTHESCLVIICKQVVFTLFVFLSFSFQFCLQFCKIVLSFLYFYFFYIVRLSYFKLLSFNISSVLQMCPPPFF